MKLAFNDQGQVDLLDLGTHSTVHDFFVAIDAFAAAHPTPCQGCRKNCCDARFFIEMDAISARKLARGDLPAFLRSALTVAYPPDGGLQILLSKSSERCRYLDAAGTCLIYRDRPATCRIYTCHPRSPLYDILDSVVVAALQHALVADHFDALIASDSGASELSTLLDEPLRWLRDTPAFRKADYRDIRLEDCIRFDMKGAGMSANEHALYARLLAMASPS